MITELEVNNKLKIIEKSLEQLKESFDNIEIFCSICESELTFNFNKGNGNWFARFAQVELLLNTWKQSFNNSCIEQEDDEFESPKDSTILKNEVAKLSEHFDSIEILCSKFKNNGTYWIHHGSGNLFTRYGHLLKWFHETFKIVSVGEKHA